jgi:hypothetical protein
VLLAGLLLVLGVWAVRHLRAPAEEPARAEAPPAGGPAAGAVAPQLDEAVHPPDQPPGGQAAPEPVSGRLTLENYARIKSGMTEPELRALLGKPVQVLNVNLPENPFVPAPREGAAAGGRPPARKVGAAGLRFLIWKRGQSEARLGLSDGVLILASATFRPDRAGLAAGARNVTQENFNRLRYGLPEAEVRRIIGPPAYAKLAGISEKEVVGGAVLRWRKGKDVIAATFANGRLTYAAGTFGGKTRTVEAPGVRHITRAGYDAVQVGMTLDEVRRILGPGQLLGPQVTLQGKTSEETLRYTDGPVFIELHFVDGRLIEKDGHVLPPS